MRIAVLYTGSVLNLEKTIPLMKDHLLKNHVDSLEIYAVLELDSPSNEAYYKELLDENLNPYMKSLEWFSRSKQNMDYIEDILMNRYNFSETDRLSIKQNGAITDQYQIFMAYQQVVHMEFMENFKYDYIVRLRTDAMITEMVGFSSFYLHTSEIKKRFKMIKKKTGDPDLNSISNLTIFMNSLLNETRIKTDFSVVESHIHHPDFYKIVHMSLSDTNQQLFYNAIKKYLKEGRYVLSFYKNKFYLGNRVSFERLPHMGINFYGQYSESDFSLENDRKWFDPEHQLNTNCKDQSISNFYSVSVLENELYSGKSE